MTYWVSGEDKQRRMSRLAPPRSSHNASGGSADLPRPLQKMPSAPTIRFVPNPEDLEPNETDKLLNGMIAHGDGYNPSRDRDYNGFTPPRPGVRDRINSEDHGRDLNHFNRRKWFQVSRANQSLRDKSSPDHLLPAVTLRDLERNLNENNCNNSSDIVERNYIDLFAPRRKNRSPDGSGNSMNRMLTSNGVLENDSHGYYVRKGSPLFRFNSLSGSVVGPPPPYASLGRRGRSGSGETSV